LQEIAAALGALNRWLPRRPGPQPPQAPEPAQDGPAPPPVPAPGPAAGSRRRRHPGDGDDERDPDFRPKKMPTGKGVRVLRPEVLQTMGRQTRGVADDESRGMQTMGLGVIMCGHGMLA
jgi:hypothetical protein